MDARAQADDATLGRERILAAFRVLSDRLGEREIMGEICIFDEGQI